MSIVLEAPNHLIKGDVSMFKRSFDSSKVDLLWEVDDTAYKIFNIPNQIIDEQRVFDADVALKLEMVKELMLTKRISTEIDYSKIEHVDLF